MASFSNVRTSSPWVCDPPADRCARPVEQPFKPGISVRHSLSCSGNVCGIFQCDGGNWRVTNQGTLDRAEWIKGWIITQLFTRGAISCNEHALKKRDGGWWADAFRSASATNGFSSGSKLWALQYVSGSDPNTLLVRAKQYAQDALRYLLSWGIVSKIKIDATLVGRSPLGWIIQLAITFYGPGVTSSFTVEGQQQPNAEYLWREYRPAGRSG